MRGVLIKKNATTKSQKEVSVDFKKCDRKWKMPPKRKKSAWSRESGRVKKILILIFENTHHDRKKSLAWFWSLKRVSDQKYTPENGKVRAKILYIRWQWVGKVKGLGLLKTPNDRNLGKVNHDLKATTTKILIWRLKNQIT